MTIQAPETRVLLSLLLNIVIRSKGQICSYRIVQTSPVLEVTYGHHYFEVYKYSCQDYLSKIKGGDGHILVTKIQSLTVSYSKS